MYKNEKFSFKLMISVNGYTEKPTSKDYNKISFEENKDIYSLAHISTRK